MTAAIFWLKTRAGWKETSVTELTGKGPAINLVMRTTYEPYSERGDGPPAAGATLPSVRVSRTIEH